MPGLREYDVVEPPTSVEVQRLARDALDIDHGDRAMTVTLLGRFAVPKPEPEELTFNISRSDYDDMGGRTIFGRGNEGQVISIHTSGTPEDPAYATVVG